MNNNHQVIGSAITYGIIAILGFIVFMCLKMMGAYAMDSVQYGQQAADGRIYASSSKMFKVGESSHTTVTPKANQRF